MSLDKILVDSGFLYALYDRDDENSAEASAVAELYRGQFVIPYVVLTEVAYWPFPSD
jgi:predicted nucleic acid-binding protein